MKSENESKGAAARSFEELHIYQRARELTNRVYALSRTAPFTKDYGLADQIRRASISIMSNIAEGFERGASTEFIQFLYIAKGSCGEVRAQLQVALDQGYITAEQHAELVDLARRTSGMISNFIAHLQKSDYRGGNLRVHNGNCSKSPKSAKKHCGLRSWSTSGPKMLTTPVKPPKKPLQTLLPLHSLQTLLNPRPLNVAVTRDFWC